MNTRVVLVNSVLLDDEVDRPHSLSYPQPHLHQVDLTYYLTLSLTFTNLTLTKWTSLTALSLILTTT